MTKDEHDELCKALTDRGLLIEAGFTAMRFTAMHPDASEIQVREMRLAFFAGAQHLLGSFISILEAGDEITEKDLQRVVLINTELNNFIEQLKAKHTKSGSA